MNEDPNWLFRKAKSFASMGMYHEAVGYYRKALTLSPKFAEAYNELGNVYLIQGNIEEALSCYRRATLFKPFYAKAWSNQGAAMLIQGSYDEAVKCFKKAVELDPSNVNAWVVQGSLMSSLCRYAEAVECFDKALEIDPGCEEAINKRKEVLKHLEVEKLRELRKTKKICLLGDPMVGKTSLIRRYVYGMFVDKYLPTIGAKVTRKVIQTLGVELTLSLWDITGLEDFRTIHPTYYQGGNGAIIICDTTRPETLSHLRSWVEAIFRVTRPIPVIFVANKIDLSPGFAVNELKRISSEFNAPCLRTSAKTGENVETAFQTLAEKLVLAP